MRLMIGIISVFLFTVVFSITAFGQSGKIAGRVTDGNTGEVLPFVKVIVEGTTQGVAPDIDGYFSIIGLHPGNYDVKASAIGYNAQTVESVFVSIDLTTDINFTLIETSVGLKEEVIVIATKSLVTKDFTSLTAIVGTDEISVLAGS